MTEPLVSIVLPVYNDTKFILEALTSVSNQSYKNIEILLVDDGSNEETKALLEQLSKTDPRIRLIRQAVNGGVASALNRGLVEALGEFIARMDSDDVSSSDRMRQVDYLLANPSYDILGGSVKIVSHPKSSGESVVSMFFNCCLVHPSVMFRKGVIQSYPLNYPSAEDYATWLGQIVNHGARIGNLGGSPVLNLRKHASNVSKTYRDIQTNSALSALATSLLTMDKNLTSDEANRSALVLQSLSTIKSPEEVEIAIKTLNLIESFLLSRYNLEEDISGIKEEISKRLGEVATNSLRLYSNPSDSPAWRLWLNRNPANQLAQLMALMGPTHPPRSPSLTQTREASTNLKTSRITVICFSKDRSFQMKEYLRTLIKFVGGVELNIVVLYKTTPPFVKSFESLKKLFPNVTWVEETNFAAQLKTIVAESEDFILWGVDDVLFYDFVSLSPALETMKTQPEVIAASIRLAPAVTFCHPSNSKSVPPKSFQLISSDQLVFQSSWMLFNRFEGTQDWDYPFELCATIFRKSDVLKIMADIETLNGIEGLSHPNKLEVAGSRLFTKKHSSAVWSSLGKCLCLSKLVLSVVTINRVQEVCENPIYTEYDLETLDRWFSEGKEFDEVKYRTKSTDYNSVHVGDVYLK